MTPAAATQAEREELLDLTALADSGQRRSSDFQSHHQLGIIVALSLVLTMTVGVVIGTLMPMLFQKVGIDLAHASGPFITSILDVSTMTIYLTIVHFFRAHLI